MTECAIAIFVKTPGLSPIKTRLAQGIGPLRAAEFYELSVRATLTTVLRIEAETVKVIPYWAVAEEEGLSDPRWKELSRVSQGSGDLGERLTTVYRKLHAAHRNVVLLGADSPHVPPQSISSLVASLCRCANGTAPARCLIGGCEDGGFYIFGSNAELSEAFWRGIEYGGDKVYTEIRARSARIAECEEVASSFDVDNREDLETLELSLRSQVQLTDEQGRLLGWLAGKSTC